jgi:DNA-binding NtrC family response regulator
MMVEYPWPGNVRELEHAIQRGATISSGPLLQLGDLSTQLVDFALHARRTLHPGVRGFAAQPGNGAAAPGGPEAALEGHFVPLAVQERQAILSTLDTLKGDKLMAAKVLGIGKTTLYRKLKEYGVADQPALPAR